MTDYSSPTVIQPNIPSHCMTPLEWLLLTNMFGWEVVNGEYYFFAEDTPNNVIEFQTKELRAAIAASMVWSLTPRSGTTHGYIFISLKSRSSPADSKTCRIALDSAL